MRSLLKVNIFVFDYSGYGASRGRPSESNLYADSQVILAFFQMSFTYKFREQSTMSRADLICVGMSYYLEDR